MATKRARRSKRRPWSKKDVRELRVHSRSKSPVKKIARAMAHGGSAPAKGTRPWLAARPSTVTWSQPVSRGDERTSI